MHKFRCMNLATFKKAVAQFEPIAYTGVILNDFSREGSRAYRTIGAPSYISASRWILRKLTMTCSMGGDIQTTSLRMFFAPKQCRSKSST